MTVKKTIIGNYTPHSVMIVADGKVVLTIPSSGVARCAVTSTPRESITIMGVEVTVDSTQFGAVEDLPAPVAGLVYIVSRFVAEAAGGRDDLYFPGSLVRDAQGNIVGCKGLSQL